jgi:hypothetical protein
VLDLNALFVRPYISNPQLLLVVIRGGGGGGRYPKYVTKPGSVESKRRNGMRNDCGMPIPTVAHKGNVNNKSDIKFKFLTSNSNSSLQIQIHHFKFKFITSNSNSSLQIQIHHFKFKFITSNSNSSLVSGNNLK